MKRFKKISAFIISAGILLQFTSCSIQQSIIKPQSVGEYFVDGKIDGEIEYNSSGIFTVNLVSSKDNFLEDIKPEKVSINYSTINKNIMPEIDSTEGILLTDNEYSTTNIVPSKVEKVSENTISIQFTDKKFLSDKPLNYTFIVDKSAVSTGKYVYAGVDVRYPSLKLVSDKTQVLYGESDLKIKLTLDGGVFKDKILPENIKLLGGFSQLEVSSIEKESDNVIAVLTKGNIGSDKYKDSYSSGEIEISPDVISNGLDSVFTSVKIINPRVISDGASTEIVNGSIVLPISLEDCLFSEIVDATMFSVSNSSKLSINGFEKISDTEGMLHIICSNKDTDSVVKELENIYFTINEKALTINSELKFKTNLLEARLNVKITDVAEEGETFNVTAVLNAVNGSFSGFNSEKLVFGGDFSKANISATSIVNNSVQIVFRIPKKMTLDTVELNGSIGLGTGILLNNWGTRSQNKSVKVAYSAQEANNIFSMNDILTEGEVTNGEKTLELLAEFAAKGDFSQIIDLVNSTYKDTESFETLYTKMGVVNANTNNIYNYIDNSIASAKNQSKALVSVKHQNVQDFLTQFSDIWIMLQSVKPKLDEMIILEKQIAAFEAENDTAQLEKARFEYNNLKSTINLALKVDETDNSEFVTNTILLGELLKDSDNNIVESFDDLIDYQYNWSTQTNIEKSHFRYYVSALYVQSAMLSMISLDDVQYGSNSYYTLKKQIQDVNNIFLQNKIVLRDDGKIKCLTLNKVFDLSPSYLSNRTYSAVTLTSSELSQLISKVKEDSSLRDEMLSVGFKLERAKYLVCSDNNYVKTTSYSNELSDDSVSWISNTVQKISVYDIINDVQIIDFTVFNNDHISAYNVQGESLNSLERTFKKITLHYLTY